MKLLTGFMLACASVTLAAAQTPADSTVSIIGQARALVDSHKLEQANSLLSAAAEQNPGNTDVLVELGEVELAQGLNEDALKAFEAELTKKPDLARARNGEVNAAEAAALADRKAGIDGDALLCLIRARKFVPDSPKLLFDFGMQADSMRIYGDADAALEQAHRLAPDDGKILYALAHVELDEQKMPEAEAHLREYLKARPDDATAHYGLGHLLHMLARADDAKSELERSIALQPRQVASYYELGEIALEMNQYDEARKEYAQVLTLAPHHGGALTGMGIIAFREKDYGTAEQYLKSAVEYAPDYVTAHHYYARVLDRLGRPAEAKRESDLADRLNVQEAKERRGNTLTVLW